MSKTDLERMAEAYAQEGTAALRVAAQAHAHLGALAALDDRQEALEAYKNASRLDPENKEYPRFVKIYSKTQTDNPLD